MFVKMNNFSSSHMRNRRNLLDLNGFAPIHFPISNYSTDAQTKAEMKYTFNDGLFINNLHLIPDPLKKNLADSVITGEEKNINMVETKEFASKEAVKPPTTQRTDFYPSLAGITNFISGVFNVMGTMFQKRTNSPSTQYYDCFESDYDDGQMAPSMPWQSSNFEVQNKNVQANSEIGSKNDSHTNLEVDMNVDCRTAVNQCEEKLNQVRLLLGKKSNQNVQNSKPNRYSRRPRKAFIEAGSVEESFEDAFTPEDFVSLANDTFIEYISPFNYHDELLIESDAPRVKTELHIHEPMEISKNLPESKDNKDTEIKQILNVDTPLQDVKPETPKLDVINSCEDKLNKLKALLKSRCNSSTIEKKNKEVDTSEPITISNQKVDVPIETVFGGEIDSNDLQNLSTSQENDFNEVTGKFYSSSVDSEDSFQIVFTDSPQNFRKRIPSECESEDSFIIFEESPDSCYTSHEVFGEDTTLDANDSSDSDSEIEEDSGCGATCKLSPNLSRTFGDLTDNSLYSEDVVDFGKHVSDVQCITTTNKMGLLLDEQRKIERKKLPAKKVTFSSLPPKVHVMRVWAFAARQARAGHWERHALDRERFKRRIADVEMAISWVLKPQHRSRVVFQRFMPWWNAEKRRELAEKKAKEEREKMEKMRHEEDDEKTIFDDTKEESENILQDIDKRDQIEKINEINEINESIETIQNDKSLMKNDDLLIKDGCIDT